MSDVIFSKDNKIYKYLKSLLQKKYRQREKLFLVEGEVVIRESLNYKIPKIIAISEEYKEKFEDIILNFNGNVYFFSKELFKNLISTENSQGIIGYFENLHLDIKNLTLGRYIFLDNLQDPGNVGGIIRSLDGFGLDGIILSKNTVELYNPKLIRSTMASIFRTRIYICDDEDILRLKNTFILIATDVNGAEESYNYKFPENFILILGNEANGVSKKLLNVAHKKIYIPIEGINSLNVNVAGSILMYEIKRNDCSR